MRKYRLREKIGVAYEDMKNRLSFKDIRVKLEGPSKNAYSDNLLGFDVSVFPPQDVKESKEGLNLILRETKRAME